MQYLNKVVLITGAAGGIGAAAARLFAAAGASLVLADIAAEPLAHLAAELEGNQTAVMTVRLDVGNEAEVEAMVSAVIDRFGRLDVAFNNAGIHVIGTPLADTSLSDWDRVHDVTLKGVFLCLKYEMRAMKRTGGGAIVNTSSAGGITGVPGVGAYVAAKHGVIGLTRTAALEGGPDGIRVNAICPGATETGMLADWLERPEAADAIRAQHPLGRWAQAGEVAAVAFFLGSDSASFMTGAIVPVDGGVTAG